MKSKLVPKTILKNEVVPNIAPNVMSNIAPYYQHGVYPAHAQFYTQNYYYPFQSPPLNYMKYIDPAPVVSQTYKKPINLTQANWFPVKMPASEIISKFYQIPNIIYGNSLVYPGYHHDEQI